MGFKLLSMLLLLPLTACGGAKEGSAANAATDSPTIAQHNSTAVRNSICPDNDKVDLEHCDFAAAMAPLKGKETAVARFKAARCGEYDQTTVNFCVGKLNASAEAELEGALDRAQNDPAFKYLVSNQSRWLHNSKKFCADKYDGNQDGTGYVSFISFCEIRLTAQRIDELGGSLPKVEI
jgi:uncharacterized protein YecT (DUF1311 family)